MSAKQKIKKKPLQVYLEPNQLDALRYQAELKGVSLAHLIRKSIDLFLSQIPLEDDPAMSIIGIGASDVDDLAENHDKYLYEILMEEHSRYQFEDKKKKEKT